MKIVLLVTPAMQMAIPTGIKDLFRAKDITVLGLDANGRADGTRTIGDNTMLEGNGKDFNKWLKPFGNVYGGRFNDDGRVYCNQCQ